MASSKSMGTSAKRVCIWASESMAQMQALFADVPMLLLDATGRPCLWAHAAVDRLAD